MPGSVLHQLHELWLKRGRCDEYIGTLVNAFLEEGGEAFSVRAGEVYVDVGTLNGYREAMRVLADRSRRSEDLTLRSLRTSASSALRRPFNAENAEVRREPQSRKRANVRSIHTGYRRGISDR